MTLKTFVDAFIPMYFLKPKQEWMLPGKILVKAVSFLLWIQYKLGTCAYHTCDIGHILAILCDIGHILGFERY